MLHRGVAHNELISTDVGNRTGKTATSASAPPGTEPRSLDDRRTYLSIDRAFKANLARLTFGLSPAVLAEQTFDWWTHLAISPEKQLQLIEKAFRKATRFGIYAAQSVANPSTPPCISPLPQDRRFQGEAWQHWPYDLIYQSFLLSQQWWHSATTKIDGLSQRNEERLSFTVRQFLDCFSPSNFVWTKSRNRTDDPHAGRSQPRERLPKTAKDQQVACRPSVPSRALQLDGTRESRVGKRRTLSRLRVWPKGDSRPRHLARADKNARRVRDRSFRRSARECRQTRARAKPRQHRGRRCGDRGPRDGLRKADHWRNGLCRCRISHRRLIPRP